jgi:hypothetical protein
LYCCRRATVSAVLKQLFLLFYYYSTIILIIVAIIRIIRKTKAALQVSIHCGNRPPSFPEAAPTQEIIILMEIVLNHLPRHPPLPNGWACCLFPGLGSICCPDVFKPTILHGLTKLRAQPFSLLGDGGTLVLPHVICQAQLATDLKSQNNQYNMYN